LYYHFGKGIIVKEYITNYVFVRDAKIVKYNFYPHHTKTAATCSRWFLVGGFFYPEDGGDMFLRNIRSHKIYTAPHPRRRHTY
jgi:hypothetical protein